MQVGLQERTRGRGTGTAKAGRSAWQSSIAIAVFLLPATTPAFSEVTSFEQVDTTADASLPRGSKGRTASLLSAFFGLDNTLPRLANQICRGAWRKDGMPVIFSTEIDHNTLQAGDFKVITASGVTGTMQCASFLPATDAGELRTVLLVGEFGNADTDPPAKVEIIGHILSIDGTLDFKGAQVDVTPLAPGPILVMAEVVDPTERDQGLGPRRTNGSKCPTENIVQAVRVVGAGGVTLENDDEPGEAEQSLYRVTVRGRDGSERDIAPAALADLGDGDNNHVLCLDTGDVPIAVSFPAGILTDPNDDPNPDTKVVVPENSEG